MRIFILIAMLTFIPLTVLATPSDEQIKEILVQQSVNSYISNVGTCPCPYSLDKAGRMCGKRSAWSKGGGYSPLCYPTDVKQNSVLEYKNKFLPGGGDEGPLKRQ